MPKPKKTKAKKASRSSRARKLKPEEVAAKHKPNWEPLPARAAPDTGSHPSAEPDEVTPELSELRKKFLGTVEAAALPADEAEAEPTTLVPMVPKRRTDAPSLGAKSAVVQGQKVIGEEG